MPTNWMPVEMRANDSASDRLAAQWERNKVTVTITQEAACQIMSALEIAAERAEGYDDAKRAAMLRSHKETILNQAFGGKTE